LGRVSDYFPPSTENRVMQTETGNKTEEVHFHALDRRHETLDNRRLTIKQEGHSPRRLSERRMKYAQVLNIIAIKTNKCKIGPNLSFQFLFPTRSLIGIDVFGAR